MSAKKKSSSNTIIDNRKARFNYEIIERYEAGIALKGTEVKSLRAGQVEMSDSFAAFKKSELFLSNLHIAEYTHGNINNHSPDRPRKLLMRKNELRKIAQKLKESGYSLVPLRLYFSNKNIIKVEIALGKGKKKYDKRETIKKRDLDREASSKYKIK